MTDREILSLLAARDERALTEVSRAYKRYCISIVSCVLENDRDCEECMNDLLLCLWNYPDPAAIKDLKQFLGAAARNLALDRYRCETRAKRGEARACEALDDFELFLSDSNVEDVFENKELARALNAFLHTLGKTERTLFIRRYYFLDGTKELSKRFSMTSGTVLRRLSRTRKKLKQYLEKEGFNL